MGRDAKIVRAVETFRRNMPLHAELCMRIKPKIGPLCALRYNSAQRYLHKRLEEIKRRDGMVRAMILKGRQQGISTYVAHRFYHRVTLFQGYNCYILGHEQDSSDTLFDMVETFQRYNPLQPKVGTDNAKELEFPAQGGRYKVAIAGHKAGGRSQANQLFHGSEVARWTNAKEHFAASVQTVPYLPGTEVILETTARGADNEFYARWQRAIKGEGVYHAIFIPWFWQDEYAITPPDDFELSGDQPHEDVPSEQDYAEMFGLSDAQMFWRRNKINDDFDGDARLFNQEYPATAEMAFAYSATDAYIPPLPVLRARRAETEPAGPLIVGVDPAGEGADRFVVLGRRGPAVTFMESRAKVGTNEAVAWIKAVVDEHHPDRVFLDAGGLGASILSAVRDLGQPYSRVVQGVHFGGRSQSKMANPKRPGPVDRRAEMYQRMKRWLMQDDVQVSIPDDEALQHDLCVVRWKATSSTDLRLESKQEMRKRGDHSPDLADALALTFASLASIREYVDRVTDQKKQSEHNKPLLVGASDPHSWMM